MSILDLSQNLPRSLTFSSSFKSIVRSAVQLTTFEGIPSEFLQTLSAPFVFYLSFLSVLQDCHIKVFTGQQPISADDTEGKDAMCLGELDKTSQEVLIKDGRTFLQIGMEGVAIDSGIISWVRVYRKELGETITAIRFDGSVGSRPSLKDFLIMPNTNVSRDAKLSMNLRVGFPDNLMFLENK